LSCGRGGDGERKEKKRKIAAAAVSYCVNDTRAAAVPFFPSSSSFSSSTFLFSVY